MKIIFAVLALLVASSFAAPVEKTLGPANKAQAPVLILPEKGEAPIKEEEQWSKGEENTKPSAESGELWIPFWDFFSNLFSKKALLPTPNNEVKMAKPAQKKPVRGDFDTSDEFLEELNVYHFGESEESRDLVEVDSNEVRHANYKAPEHVRDAILYNKVMPKKEDYDDYGDFLEATNRNLMGPTVVHKKKKPAMKSTWTGWFNKW